MLLSAYRIASPNGQNLKPLADRMRDGRPSLTGGGHSLPLRRQPTSLLAIRNKRRDLGAMFVPGASIARVAPLAPSVARALDSASFVARALRGDDKPASQSTCAT
jgi:hypothetical protein